MCDLLKLIAPIQFICSSLKSTGSLIKNYTRSRKKLHSFSKKLHSNLNNLALFIY